MDEEPSFKITLKSETAWFLRDNLLLGPRFSIPEQHKEDAEKAYHLRGMVNDAIIAFSSNNDTKTFEIEINEDQAFIIDQMIKADPEDEYRKLAMQVIRGMWALQHKVDMPVRTVRDPWVWLTGDMIRSRLDSLE